jgi:threonine/homoserine/homoserine lactone efflux protein
MPGTSGLLLHMTVAFLLTTLVIVATPGTGVLFTVAAGLSRSARASVVAAIGCTLGVVPHMIAAITGLAALLNASAVAFQTLKYMGVAYLLYLAWQTWRDRTPLEVDRQATPQSVWQVIRTAVLINLLNPKLTIFFFALLPQLVHPGEHATIRHMVGLSLVFMAVTFVVFTSTDTSPPACGASCSGGRGWSPGCVGRSRPPMSCSPDVWPFRTGSCECGSRS